MRLLTFSAAIVMSLALALASCGGGGSSVQAQTSGTTVGAKDLSAFLNTYWYVPTAYLPAYKFANLTGTPTLTQVSDQTVWHITQVGDGYLSGCSFVSTDGTGASWTASTLVGSVAPNNAVNIGFYSGSGVTLAQTVGLGQLTSVNGQTAFLMQVSAMPGAIGLTHWAYMLPVVSTDAIWSSLPGTNTVSVPTATAAGCS